MSQAVLSRIPVSGRILFRLFQVLLHPAQAATTGNNNRRPCAFPAAPGQVGIQRLARPLAVADGLINQGLKKRQPPGLAAAVRFKLAGFVHGGERQGEFSFDVEH